MVFGSRSERAGRLGSALAGCYGALNIKARLLLLVGTLFAPCCGLVLYAIGSTENTADASIRRGLLYSVQAVSAAVDAELRRHAGVAEMLARSPAVLQDDLSAFAAEVQRASVATGDNWVLVADLDGRVLMNTAAKPGRDLGSRSIEGWESQTRAIRTGTPSVSDIFVGPTSHEWIATVDVPILKDGRPFRCLAISMRAVNFTRLLAQQQVPSDWLVGIIDTSGRYVSRIPRNATQTGQFASEGWRATVNVPGISEFTSIEGDKVINANAHPTLSRWTVGVGIKESAFAGEIAATIRTTAVAAIAISALALLLAAGIAASIARPLREIGSGEGAQPAGRISDPPEIRALRFRLVEAELVRRRSERANSDNIALLAQARDMWLSTAEQLKLAAKYGGLGT
ncbi:MAG: cache domain-containing protein, partial [Bradyrhizobium sp.]|uniref:cache domain-containing protein n=1 Tax=Bradyrhizobium sp. TaxID=376 RepID=UPI001DDA6084